MLGAVKNRGGGNGEGRKEGRRELFKSIYFI